MMVLDVRCFEPRRARTKMYFPGSWFALVQILSLVSFLDVYVEGWQTYMDE